MDRWTAAAEQRPLSKPAEGKSGVSQKACERKRALSRARARVRRDGLPAAAFPSGLPVNSQPTGECTPHTCGAYTPCSCAVDLPSSWKTLFYLCVQQKAPETLRNQNDGGATNARRPLAARAALPSHRAEPSAAVLVDRLVARCDAKQFWPMPARFQLAVRLPDSRDWLKRVHHVLTIRSGVRYSRAFPVILSQ